MELERIINTNVLKHLVRKEIENNFIEIKSDIMKLNKMILKIQDELKILLKTQEELKILKK